MEQRAVRPPTQGRACQNLNLLSSTLLLSSQWLFILRIDDVSPAEVFRVYGCISIFPVFEHDLLPALFEKPRAIPDLSELFMAIEHIVK